MKMSTALPGLRQFASYRASWLRQDIVAGVVLTTLLVPQGMAYAELAGLPVITGLYTTILCLLGYAVFGPSRILVLGPDSSLGPMIAATLIPIIGSGGSPERAVELASMLALLVGVFMLAAGVAKLGFVADLLSKPTQIGYMNGLALTILIGQLPKLFGFSTDANGLIDEIHAFVHGLASGEAVGAAAAVGLLSLALILALGRWLPRVPGVLAAVVVAIAAAGAFNLSDHGVSVVGTLPTGFPPFTVPTTVSDLPLLVAGALGHRAGRADRHDLDRFSVRCAHGTGGRRQWRDDRHRRRQRRRWVLPGLPGEHQRFADGGRRADRRQDAADGRGRGGRDRADARACSRAAAKPAAADARSGGDRGVAVAGRHRWHRAAVAPATRRVPAHGHRVPGGRAPRRAGGDRRRGRALDPERVPARLAAVRDHPRQGPRPGRVSRSPRATPTASDCPASRSSASTRRCSSPTRGHFAI